MEVVSLGQKVDRDWLRRVLVSLYLDRAWMSFLRKTCGLIHGVLDYSTLVLFARWVLFPSEYRWLDEMLVHTTIRGSTCLVRCLSKSHIASIWNLFTNECYLVRTRAMKLVSRCEDCFVIRQWRPRKQLTNLRGKPNSCDTCFIFISFSVVWMYLPAASDACLHTLEITLTVCWNLWELRELNREAEIDWNENKKKYDNW